MARVKSKLIVQQVLHLLCSTQAIVAKHVTGCSTFSMFNNYGLLLELHALTQAARLILISTLIPSVSLVPRPHPARMLLPVLGLVLGLGLRLPQRMGRLTGY